jgi:thiol-disulfide isomerase/thioredoxin
MLQRRMNWGLASAGLAWVLSACFKAPPDDRSARGHPQPAASEALAAVAAPSATMSARSDLVRSPSASVRSDPAANPASAPDASASAEPAGSALATIRADELVALIRGSGAKGTLVNAWASFCGPCRREIPMLQALAPNLRQEGIHVILVSVDDPEDSGKAEAFLKGYDVRLPAYLAARPLGVFKVGLNPRWPGMLPATFFFDQTGKLRYFWGGPVYDNEILAVVDDYLAGKHIDGEADFTIAPGKVD